MSDIDRQPSFDIGEIDKLISAVSSPEQKIVPPTPVVSEHPYEMGITGNLVFVEKGSKPIVDELRAVTDLQIHEIAKAEGEGQDVQIWQEEGTSIGENILGYQMGLRVSDDGLSALLDVISRKNQHKTTIVYERATKDDSFKVLGFNEDIAQFSYTIDFQNGKRTVFRTDRLDSKELTEAEIETQRDRIREIVTQVQQKREGVDTDFLGNIDSLISTVDQSLLVAKSEVSNWTLEKKRTQAATSTESFTLSNLAEDPHPIVRALVCSNPNTNPIVLKRIAQEGNHYMGLCIANNPTATPETLDLLAESGIEEIVDAVAKHPHVSKVTLFRIQAKLAETRQDDYEY